LFSNNFNANVLCGKSFVVSILRFVRFGTWLLVENNSVVYRGRSSFFQTVKEVKGILSFLKAVSCAHNIKLIFCKVKPSNSNLFDSDTTLEELLERGDPFFLRFSFCLFVCLGNHPSRFSFSFSLFSPPLKCRLPPAALGVSYLFTLPPLPLQENQNTGYFKTTGLCTV